MIRYFVLLFNMVGVLIFRTFFVDDVTVKQNVPAKANPGDEFTVEVTINKGSMGGFAQLKCELPEGFTATQGEVSGSEFKFSGQIVRFTWTSLPGDATLKVSYKVKVAPGTNGVKSITGKFSYVLNNVKNSIELNASEITIGTPVVDNVDNTVTTSPTTTTSNNNTTTTTPPDNTTTTSNNNNTSTTTTTDQGNTTTTTTTPPDNGNTNKTSSVADVKVDRKVPKDAKPGDEITVEVVINKGNLKGFARFQDVMPEGLTASAGDSKGGTFSFVDQKAKIVWDNIPAEEQITITYKIKVTSAALGDQTIEGLFSYVENDEPKKIILTPSTITIDKPVDNTTVNNNTTTTTNNNNNTNTTTTSNNNNTNTTTTTDNTTTNTNTTTDNTTTKVPDNNITNTPPPSTGVTYKVQICAAHNTVDGSYFQNKYSIGAKINIESHEGWVKYTTGSFPVYKDARDHRETLRSKGVDGPFVTAYNKGTRITVQEALMIAGQQWYK